MTIVQSVCNRLDIHLQVRKCYWPWLEKGDGLEAFYMWFFQPYSAVSIVTSSISFVWYSVHFRAQPIISLILFLWTCGSPSYLSHYYLFQGWNWTISSVSDSTVGMLGKELGRGWENDVFYYSQVLERISSGRENKEGVDFLCFL